MQLRIYYFIPKLFLQKRLTMNKKFTYPIAIGLFIIITAFIVIRFEKKEKQNMVYELKDRNQALMNNAEWTKTRTEAAKYKMAIKENPADKASALGLATIFIQEARITGDYTYYDMAAMKQVDNVLALDSNNFQALTYKALIYLSQHHFGDGRDVAEKAQKLNPYNSFIYGILLDANVEMGNYPEAVSDADKMVSIRPDLRSYSRISYLREIHGDYPGAIEAMKRAVEAGLEGEESTEWARIQLGHLYENTGDIKSAEMHYTIALTERKNYAYALAGLGRIAAWRKDYPTAINYYQRADSLVNDYAFKEQLADIFKAAGQKDKAKALYQNVVDDMSKDSKSATDNANIGHYVDRELAYAYLKINDNDQALEHALAEYNRRPENIDVNETVALVYHKQGKDEKALPYIKTALKTNCKNPTLLCHAGLIYAKAGNKAEAKTELQEALKNDPNIDLDLKNESAEVLKTL